MTDESREAEISQWAEYQRANHLVSPNADAVVDLLRIIKDLRARLAAVEQERDALREALEIIKGRTFYHMVRYHDGARDRKVLGEIKEIAIAALAALRAKPPEAKCQHVNVSKYGTCEVCGHQF